MARPLDWTALQDRLLTLLDDGSLGAPELQEALGISQPSFSRLVHRSRRDIVAFGLARLRRYGRRRPLGAQKGPLPVYEVDEDGGIAERCHIEAIAPNRLVVEGPGVRATEFDDLPWFLEHLRPVGWPGLPWRPPGWPEVPDWTADRALEYAARFGWNLPSAFVVGSSMARLRTDHSSEVVYAADRAEAYALRARDTAAFLATRRGPDGDVPVIVRSAPPPERAAHERLADLLVAEHLALRTLAATGLLVAPSALFHADGHVFLEVERFDRTAVGGRRAIASLRAVAPHFTDLRGSRWGAVTAKLLERELIDANAHRETRLREQFADWIGDPDPPAEQLVFRLEGLRLAGLAPVGAARPSAFAPVDDELPSGDPPLRAAHPDNRDVSWDAQQAALAFWSAVREDARISDGFRDVARLRRSRLARLRA